MEVPVLYLEYLNLKPDTIFFRIADVGSGARVELPGISEPETCYVLFRIADVSSSARVEVRYLKYLNLMTATFYSG